MDPRPLADRTNPLNDQDLRLNDQDLRCAIVMTQNKF
jgi:hypothetical protein